MPNTLLTGVSGLATHQRMIDVVGHNLANLNTAGFKSRRASFADVFYETIRSGSGGAPGAAVGTVGGSNPAQLGNGSKLASVAVNHSRGELEVTGATYDMALDGDGFFVVKGTDGPLYTRAGAFGVDNDGYLVDTSTGYRVQRYGTIGESLDSSPGFQQAGSTNILVSTGAAVQGQQTSEITIRGNLSPSAQALQAELITSFDSLRTGGDTADATLTDLLNDLDIISADFAPGDTINVSGVNQDGSELTATLNVDDTTTMADFISQLSAALPDATASLTDDGKIEIEADEPGISHLQVNFEVGAGSTGAADLGDPPFSMRAVKNGAEAEVTRASLEVYDSQGTVHIIGVEFHKGQDNLWDMRASIDSDSGVMTDDVITGISFNEDGSFAGVHGTGINGAALEVQFDDISDPQRVEINFGEIGSLAGVTSISGNSQLSSYHDGLPAGVLNSVAIDENGLIEGVASNGRRVSLAQIAVAKFRNPNGLSSEGDNMFRSTPSSGTVEMGAARTGGRGGILTGQLESSNVDIALEFTRLIIAQRGFSANARTITVADEILEELTNIVR